MINGYEYDISSYNSCELDDIISNYISDNSKKEGRIFYLEGGKTYHFSNNCVIYKGFTLCTKPEDVANGKRATVCLSGMTRSYDNEDLINTCNFMLGRQLGVSESPADNLNIGTVRFVDIDFQVPMACNIGDQTDKKGNTCGNYFIGTVPSGKDHHTDTGIQGLFYQTTNKVKNSQIYKMKVGAPMLYK